MKFIKVHVPVGRGSSFYGGAFFRERACNSRGLNYTGEIYGNIYVNITGTRNRYGHNPSTGFALQEVPYPCGSNCCAGCGRMMVCGSFTTPTRVEYCTYVVDIRYMRAGKNWKK